METNEFGNVSLRNDGYYYITSKKNNGKLLHRLIFEKYYGEIPDGFCVHHKDHDKRNNNISNLELIPKSVHHTLHNSGSSHPLWGSSLIDDCGGIDFLAVEKSKGKTMTEIAMDIGYTAPAPISQYLKIRNLCWNDI